MIDLTGLTDKEWAKRYTNFSKEELSCKCCGLLNIDLDFLDEIQAARIYADFPFPINSGCRCEKYNKEINGHPNSLHITSENKKCQALDIGCKSDNKRALLLNSIFVITLFHIGIHSEFIHVDRSIKVAAWLY